MLEIYEENSMAKKPLTKYSDEELNDALEHEIQNVHYWARDYMDEITLRREDRNTKTLNRLTFVIAGATLVNTIATVVLAVINILK